MSGAGARCYNIKRWGHTESCAPTSLPKKRGMEGERKREREREATASLFWLIVFLWLVKYHREHAHLYTCDVRDPQVHGDVSRWGLLWPDWPMHLISLLWVRELLVNSFLHFHFNIDSRSKGRIEGHSVEIHDIVLYLSRCDLTISLEERLLEYHISLVS